MNAEQSELTVLRSRDKIYSGDRPSPFKGVKEIMLRDYTPLLGPRPYGSPEFECSSPIGEDNRKRMIQLMLNLPDDSGHQLFIESGNLAEISIHNTSHIALERMYVGPTLDLEEGDESNLNWARLFIENTHNSMAVRNRLRIVKQVFASHVQALAGAGLTEINTLSIAAGSSRGIIEALVRLNGEGHNINLRLIDLNRKALDDARKLISEYDISESVELIRAHYRAFHRYLEEGYHPHCVEIVGLVDYLDDERGGELLIQVRNNMSKNGKVIVSNIAPNDEQPFTHTIVGWGNMFYRSAEDLIEMVRLSGFSTISLIKEPLGVYNLVVAQP